MKGEEKKTKMPSGRLNRCSSQATHDITASTLAPDGATRPQDKFSRNMITISNQPARRTRVNALFQGLAHFCTAQARLRRPRWIDFYQYASGTFSLVREHEKESRPSSVVNTLGEHSARQSLDVQIFDRNKAVSVNQFARFLVMKVPTLIADVIVESLEQQHCFTSPIRSPVSPRYAPLQTPELSLSGSEPTRIFNRASIAERGKAAEPNVDPDHVWTKHHRCWLILNRKQCEPSPGLAFHGEGFDSTLQWSVSRDFNRSDFRESQPVSVQCLSDQAEGHAVVTAHGFESWETRLRATSDSAEETAKRIPNPAQSILKHGGINRLDIRSICSDVFQLQVLIEPGDRLALELPRVPSFLKRGVIKLATNSKLFVQDLLLAFCGVDPVAEGLDHALILSREFSFTKD